MSSEDEARGGHRRGFRPIRRLAPALLRGVMARRGLSDVRLVTEWRAIAGSELAALARPVKLAFPRGRRSGAVLHLEVESAAAPLIQHAAPQLVERVNALLGYGAVARLKLHHAPVAAQSWRGEEGLGLPAPARAAGDAAEPPAPPAALDRIADPGLRAALARLGRAVGRR